MKRRLFLLFLTTVIFGLCMQAANISLQEPDLQSEIDPWIDYIQTSRNPVVTRISAEEIRANSTPAAVAYNFVNAILTKDIDKMLSNATPRFKEFILDALNNLYHGNEDAYIANEYSEGKLGILSWKPALANGYEVAVAFIQDESVYYEDGYWCGSLGNYTIKNGKIYLPKEDIPRLTKVIKKIYITCSPTSEVNYVGFQDITRYGSTNVKPLVEYYNGKWLVDGFK